MKRAPTTPFRSASTRSPARPRRSPYATHVDQMIRQVLLTTPGERADLPEFGCGLRQLLFAPNTDALQATTQLIVQQSLNQWLGDQIKVQTVTRTPRPRRRLLADRRQIAYMLMETQSQQQTSGRW